MATETFIQSEPSMNGVDLPANAGELIRTSQWGIDSVLSGYIIQNVQISHEKVTDITESQKGARCGELDFDEIWNGSMEVIGGDGNETGDLPNLSVGMLNFPWAGKLWKLDSCQYQGSYNDKKRYSLVFHRTRLFPAQS